MNAIGQIYNSEMLVFRVEGKYVFRKALMRGIKGNHYQTQFINFYFASALNPDKSAV
jgi:hypothetical protein